MLKLLEGKKTYIGAAALAIAALVGYHYGVYDGTTASAMASAALIAVGLGHKYDRLIEKALEIAAKK